MYINVDSSELWKVRENVCSGRRIYGEKKAQNLYDRYRNCMKSYKNDTPGFLRLTLSPVRYRLEKWKMNYDRSIRRRAIDFVYKRRRMSPDEFHSHRIRVPIDTWS